MFFYFKNHLFIILCAFIILSSCQIQEPLKTHGIIFLENRSNKLIINKSNKNDVIRIIGQPQIKNNTEDTSWIYIERILTKGKYHKLGKHVLKENNVLVLNFDKYGVLKSKKFLNKNDVSSVLFFI